MNRVAKLDPNPIPCIEDFFASLSRRKLFLKLDLALAYQQIPLDDASKPFVMINTHKGLFQYNWLPFGVASVPAIYQWAMESILQGIEHVTKYIDDTLTLSRLPLRRTPKEVPLPGETTQLLDNFPVSPISPA